MVGPLALIYIRKHTGLGFPEIREALSAVEGRCRGYDVRFLFTMFFGRNILTANSFLPGTRLVLVSADWGVSLADCEHEGWIPATEERIWAPFFMTVGHEAAHKEGLPRAHCRTLKGMVFASWVGEVCCDYRSCETAFLSDAGKGLCAMARKMELKGNPALEGPSHPSWLRRQEYLSELTFDGWLIDRIARDIGGVDPGDVRRVKDAYSDRHISLTAAG